jgi:hypothetical protein
MALQSDAIQNRLDGLKQDDRRSTFDSQLRSIRQDSQSRATVEDRGSKMARRPEAESSVDQMIGLLEELSRRIDGLEKKNRSLSEEIRHRARRDRRWRSITLAGGLAVSGLLVAGWFLRWF